MWYPSLFINTRIRLFILIFILNIHLNIFATHLKSNISLAWTMIATLSTYQYCCTCLYLRCPRENYILNLCAILTMIFSWLLFENSRIRLISLIHGWLNWLTKRFWFMNDAPLTCLCLQYLQNHEWSTLTITL